MHYSHPSSTQSRAGASPPACAEVQQRPIRGLTTPQCDLCEFYLKSTPYPPYIYCMEDIIQNTSTNHSPTPAERGTAWLTGAGLRPTRQRVALAALLIGDGQHRHVTAESLFGSVQTEGESVSLATVYNTLRAFCDAGLMQEVLVDGAKSYFDTNTHDHPHFFWEDENRLTDAPADQLEITRLPDAPEGAEIASVDVVIRLRRRS